MIKYNPKTWFDEIFAFHKSDTITILWKELIFIGLLTLGLSYIEIHYFKDTKYLSELIAVYSLIGFVLSLLLVFRTNTAYDRWWEGRKKWGELVNNSRNLSIKLKSMVKDEEDLIYFQRMIPNFAFSLKEHLRDNYNIKELNLETSEIEELKNLNHKPNFFILKLYKKVQSLKKKNQITEIEYLSIDNDLKTFSDILGACERIKNTPIPYSYSMFLKKFIFIYVTTVPLAFVHYFGYYSALIAIFIFYVLVSLEILAEEIEDPFGTDSNDLPTEELSEKIKANVKEILE